MKTIIGGDSTEAEISAASIIAKVYWDNLMISYDKKYPVYCFKQNKGYGTQKHLEHCSKKLVILKSIEEHSREFWINEPIIFSFKSFRI